MKHFGEDDLSENLLMKLECSGARRGAKRLGKEPNFQGPLCGAPQLRMFSLWGVDGPQILSNSTHATSRRANTTFCTRIRLN